MDDDTLRQLYEFNISFQEDEGPDSRKRKAKRPENWAGHSIRIMLTLIYILSFLCLLRFDEVLNIKWSWIKLEIYKGKNRIKLSLPYRKTHQFGGRCHMSITVCSAAHCSCIRHSTFLPLRELAAAMALSYSRHGHLGKLEPHQSKRLCLSQKGTRQVFQLERLAWNGKLYSNFLHRFAEILIIPSVSGLLYGVLSQQLAGHWHKPTAIRYPLIPTRRLPISGHGSSMAHPRHLLVGWVGRQLR